MSIEQQGMIRFVIIAVYMLLLLILGVVASRLLKSGKKDYLLASHSIGPFLLLMSLFGTTMTAFALVGSSGEAYDAGIGVYGMLASSSGIIHSLCFFVIGVKLWSFGKKYGYTTQIQYFRERLDNNGIGLLLFPILVSLVIPYLLIGVLAGGIVVQQMTDGAFPSLFPGEAVAAKPAPPAKPAEAPAAEAEADAAAPAPAAEPDKPVAADPANKPVAAAAKPGGKGPPRPRLEGAIPRWLGSAVICLIVLTYVFFGGMRGTAWANAFQTVVFMVLGLVAFVAISFALGGKDSFFENLQVASEAVGPSRTTRQDMSMSKFLTYMLVPLSVGMFPHLFQHWLTAKSASSFKLSVVAHPVFIMIVWVPCVLIGIWATTSLVKLPPPVAANPNAVLVFLVKTKTDPYLGGLLTAGILAAIMSSLDSQFLCVGTMFGNDIVNHYAGKDRFSDTQQVWIARGFIVAVVVLTYLLALLNPAKVFDLGVWCFSGFASLFPLVLASVYWKRLTAAGAYACVITTIVVWSILFWLSDFGNNGDFSVDIPTGGEPIETMPVATIFICSVIALVVVSLVTKPPRQEVVDKFFSK